MDCCQQPEPDTTDPGTKPVYLHSESSMVKLIKVFNLSSLVQNSTYFSLAPDLSCGMIPRVDSAAELHQGSTMAELMACTAPVMLIITQGTSAAASLCASKECHLPNASAVGFTLPSADTAIRRELLKLMRLVSRKTEKVRPGAFICRAL